MTFVPKRYFTFCSAKKYQPTNGGKGEEEEADGDEGETERTEAADEGLLGEFDACGLSVENAGGEDDESGHVQDHERIDEQADNGHEALLGRELNLGDSVGVGRGAEAGFIGEEAAGHAVTHGFLDGRSDDATRGGLRIESAHEDHLEGGNNLFIVGKDYDEAAENVEEGHDGHDLLGSGGDSPEAAKEDKGGEAGDKESGVQRGNAKGVLEGNGDGVGLHHVADEPRAMMMEMEKKMARGRQCMTVCNVVGGAARSHVPCHLSF